MHYGTRFQSVKRQSGGRVQQRIDWNVDALSNVRRVPERDDEQEVSHQSSMGRSCEPTNVCK